MSDDAWFEDISVTMVMLLLANGHGAVVVFTCEDDDEACLEEDS